MILTQAEVDNRLSSPNNLINQLRTRLNSAGRINSIIQNSENIRIPEIVKSSETSRNQKFTSDEFIPNLDELIPDSNDKLAIGLAKTKAVNVMNSSLDELQTRIGDVDSPKQLATIAKDMSSIINGLTPEGDGLIKNQVIIYKPIVVNESHYETIAVLE